MRTRDPHRETEPAPLAIPAGREVRGINRSAGEIARSHEPLARVNGATHLGDDPFERRAGGPRGAEDAARSIELLLIEDHPIVREGLRMLLSAAAGITVVGEADCGENALRALRSPPPDVLLYDVDLGCEEALVVLRRIAVAAPAAKVLALTTSHDPLCHRAVLHAGARGVVTKDSTVELILKAIRKVSAGELWFERHVLDAALTVSSARHDELTTREREVIALIGEGLKNCEIAGRLCISKKTVRNHLCSIFGKLDVSDRLELLVHAYQLGLVNIPRRP